MATRTRAGPSRPAPLLEVRNSTLQNVRISVSLSQSGRGRKSPVGALIRCLTAAASWIYRKSLALACWWTTHFNLNCNPSRRHMVRVPPGFFFVVVGALLTETGTNARNRDSEHP